jgi:hypothetical protein
MQNSNINPSIKYIESSQIHSNDIGSKNIQVYEITLLNTPIFICVGNFNTDIENIIYSPIYLLSPKNFTVIKQIGIFEFEPHEIDLFKTPEDTLLLENIKSPPKYPIIYSFVTKELLEKYSSSNSTTDNPPTSSDDPPIPPDDPPIPPDDPPITPDDLDDFSIKMKPELNDGSLPWFAFFFNDVKFRLHSVPGDGDCFFASVSDAFATIGENRSIKELRTVLAENLTQEIYQSYKDRQLEIENAIANTENENTILKKQISDLLKTAKSASSNDTKIKIAEEIKVLKDQININKFQSQIAPDLLAPFKWISNINSLAQMKEFVSKTSNEVGFNCYWADEVAISLLENTLNVKFIIVRDNDSIKDAKPSANLHNMDPVDALEELNKLHRVILDCGERIEKDGKPLSTINSPDYYIILDHQGNHYELIKYENKGIFRYDELHDNIKNIIIQRCVELGKSSKYSQIPEFIKLAEEFKANNPPPPTIPLGSHDSSIDSQKSLTASINGLFDENIHFLFYKGSANRKPGEGTGEKIDIPIPDRSTFKELESDKFKDWRKKLSDTFEDSKMYLDIDGKSYTSIQEFYVKNKLLPKDKEKTPYDLDKTLVHRALLTKFRDNNQEPLFLKDILLATKNAKLLKYNRGQEPTVALDLMYLRKKLSE